MATPKTAARKPRRKEKKNVAVGQAHIKSTFNNTIVSITDPSGAVLSWASSGAVGFKGSRKSTPFAAQLAAESAARQAQEHGVKKVDVFVKSRVRVARPRSARSRPLASRSARSTTSRRRRTTGAARPSAVASDARSNRPRPARPLTGSVPARAGRAAAIPGRSIAHVCARDHNSTDPSGPMRPRRTAKCHIADTSPKGIPQCSLHSAPP